MRAAWSKMLALVLALLLLCGELPVLVSQASNPFVVLSVWMNPDGKSLKIVFNKSIRPSDYALANLGSVKLKRNGTYYKSYGFVSATQPFLSNQMVVMLSEVMLRTPDDVELSLWMNTGFRARDGSVLSSVSIPYRFLNNSDAVAGKITAASIDSSGLTAKLTFSLPIDLATVPVSSLRFNQTGAVKVAYADSGKRTLLVTLAQRMAPGLVKAHCPSTAMRSTDRTPIEPFADFPVANYAVVPILLNGATVNADGRSITVALSRAVRASSVSVSDFSAVTVRSGSLPVRTLAVTAATVASAQPSAIVLTLNGVVLAGEAFSITLRELKWRATDGVAVTRSAGYRLVNNSAVAPLKLVGGTSSTNGDALTLTFNKPVDSSLLLPAALTVAVSGGSSSGRQLAVTALTPVAGQPMQLRAALQQPVLQGQRLTVSAVDLGFYARDGAPLRAPATLSFDSTTAKGPSPIGAKTDATGGQLLVSFDGDLKADSVPGALVTLSGGWLPRGVVAQRLVGPRQLELTLSAPVLDGETGLTLSYNPYDPSALRGSATGAATLPFDRLAVVNDSTLVTASDALWLNGLATVGVRDGSTVTVTPDAALWASVVPTMVGGRRINGFGGAYKHLVLTAADPAVTRFVLVLTPDMTAALKGAALSLQSGRPYGVLAAGDALFGAVAASGAVSIDFDARQNGRLVLSVSQNGVALPLGSDEAPAAVAYAATGVYKQPNGSLAFAVRDGTTLCRSWQTADSTLALTAAGGRFVTTVKAPAVFADMVTWAKNQTALLNVRGVAGGVGNDSYRPMRAITRAEFAALLVRLLNAGVDTSSTTPFTDCTTGWYAPVLLKARAMGVVGGLPDGRFLPDAPISRQDMAVMLYRVMRQYSFKPVYDAGDLGVTLYGDWRAVDGYAQPAMAALCQSGILAGSNGLLAPKAAANRAEAAVVMARLLARDANNIKG